ncbi:MAG: DUF1570 domain-containing protein [Planctomycetaceae bacterium]
MQNRVAQIAMAMAMVGLAAPSVCDGARREMIEVHVDGTAYTGQAVAYNANTFWLLQRDGRLIRLPVQAVKQFRTVAPRFRAFRAREMRERLRKEFGPEFEVTGTRHYLVVAPKGRARKYTQTFETVCRRFLSHFGAARFRLDKLKFPLVAVVFPNKRQFNEYAKRDGVNATAMIAGYYHPRSNRIAVYDTVPTLSATRPHRKPQNAGPATRFARPAGTNPRLHSTIIHETTHQIAFNAGLHSRIGASPKWVVEGLATVFEAPGIRNRTGGRGAASRINSGRLRRFQNYAKTRKPRSLSHFLAGDDPFRATPLDAYAEAWALSFFLMETQSRNYSKYLRLLAKRDPLKPYYARDRLKDFQAAFGKDVDRLEVSFLRFIDDLRAADTPAAR